MRICTASGIPGSQENLDQYLKAGCDFIAPHLARDKGSSAKTVGTINRFWCWILTRTARCSRARRSPAVIFLHPASGRPSPWTSRTPSRLWCSAPIGLAMLTSRWTASRSGSATRRHAARVGWATPSPAEGQAPNGNGSRQSDRLGFMRTSKLARIDPTISTSKLALPI